MAWPGPLEDFYDSLVSRVEVDWKELRRERDGERGIRDNGRYRGEEKGHKRYLWRRERKG